MSIPSLITEQGTLFDYDLNIYHTEESSIDEDGQEVWAYTDQWYVDIYEYLRNDFGGSEQVHVAGPFKITSQQRDLLQLEDGNQWDSDSWYGMWGLMQDYEGNLLPELLDILNALPKYKEEVLF
jgi:hypothetical protein